MNGKLLIAMPTIDGREDALQTALDAFGRTTEIDCEVVVVRNRPSCGEGWLDAVEQGGDFDYLFLASDDQIPEPGWLEPLVEAVDRGCLPCCVILNPDGTVQSAGGELGAPENVHKEIREDWTPVGFSPFPFMGREQWGMIGMLPVQQFSDVWVSYRGRQFGYDVVLRPESRIVHTYHDVGRSGGQDRRAADKLVVETALGVTL